MVYLLDRGRPGICGSRTTRASRAPAAVIGSARSGSRSGPGCSAAPSRVARSSTPTTTSPTRRSTTRPIRTGSSRDIGIRSMVAAPLVYGRRGLRGARRVQLAARRPSARRSSRSSARWPTTPPRPWPMRASSRPSTTRGRSSPQRAEAERSLREIGARISAAADLPAVLQRAVDEAARLLPAEGARIDLDRPGAWSCSGRRTHRATKPARRRGLARRPGGDPRRGHLRQGRRHRTSGLDRRLRQGPRVPARSRSATPTCGASGSARSWPRRSSARPGRSAP